jgi:hypothetical protein
MEIGNWKLVGKMENGNWDCFVSLAMTGVWDGILRFTQNDGEGQNDGGLDSQSIPGRSRAHDWE